MKRDVSRCYHGQRRPSSTLRCTPSHLSQSLYVLTKTVAGEGELLLPHQITSLGLTSMTLA